MEQQEKEDLDKKRQEERLREELQRQQEEADRKAAEKARRERLLQLRKKRFYTRLHQKQQVTCQATPQRWLQFQHFFFQQHPGEPQVELGHVRFEPKLEERREETPAPDESSGKTSDDVEPLESSLQVTTPSQSTTDSKISLQLLRSMNELTTLEASRRKSKLSLSADLDFEPLGR